EDPSQADSNTPAPMDQTVKVGETPSAEKSIGNMTELPAGTKVAFETPVDTSKSGEQQVTVLVTYPDGSQDKVSVTVKVAENPSQADSNTPAPMDQTVKVGETPSAEKSIGNMTELPAGTKVAFETPVDTSKSGEQQVTVVVTYPDGSQDKVSVTIKVVLPEIEASGQDEAAKDNNDNVTQSMIVGQKSVSSESKTQVSAAVAATGQESLPNTGEQSTDGAMALGVGLLLSAIGLKARRRREED
ncbi:Rib/alpha-like domain-containing protein, partial [Streptococcus danieliae]